MVPEISIEAVTRAMALNRKHQVRIMMNPALATANSKTLLAIIEVFGMLRPLTKNPFPILRLLSVLVAGHWQHWLLIDN